MKRITSTLFLLLILAAARGQGWERTYPVTNQEAFYLGSILTMPDGGYLVRTEIDHSVIGQPAYDIFELHRISADGALQWTKTQDEVFGARVVNMKAVDGQHLLFVTFQPVDSVFTLVKTDGNLQVLWTQVLSANKKIGIVGLEGIADQYVVATVKYGQFIDTDTTFISAFDPAGNVLWKRAYELAWNHTISSMLSDSQGNIYFFGQGDFANLSQHGSVISKVSASGDFVFSNVYQLHTAAFGSAIVNDSLIAYSDTSQYVHFIDNNGLALYDLNIGTHVQAIAATGDGNLLLTLLNTGPEVKKIDLNGNQIWDYKKNNLNIPLAKLTGHAYGLPDGGSIVLFNSFVVQGRPYFVARIDVNGHTFTNRLRGNIFADSDNDCVYTPDPDVPARAVTLSAEGGDQLYYTTTDSLGNYDFDLENGTYLFRLYSPSDLWQPCVDSMTFSFDTYDTLVWNNGITSDFNCPWPSVDLSTGTLIRCSANNHYAVAYGNSGNITADSAVVVLTLDDYLVLQSASIPYTDLGNNMYAFPVGDLAPLQIGSFSVQILVSCDAAIGQTHCSAAAITIANPCPTTGLEIPIIDLRVACEGDSVAYTIKNIGGAPMTDPAEFVVIEDLIVMRQGEFQLPSQDSTIVKCPADGSTSRMYAGQAPGEPPYFSATAAIEGCNGPLEPDYWNMFPEIRPREDIDRDCQENVGSYDPNDKKAIPSGYGDEHLIARGVPLDYTIRFQNTGTYTAFNVVLRDTLSDFLNVLSVRPTVASHPYTWQLLGNGVLEFRFENIFLPDSSTDLAGSQGFVQFHIEQKPDLPLETLIENKAAIYFDFNAPVITNTVWHRIGENFLPLVAAWEPAKPGVLLRVAPNPAGETARVELNGWDGNEPLLLQLFDTQGNLLRELRGNGTGMLLERGGLPDGLYLFEISSNGRVAGRGKLILSGG